MRRIATRFVRFTSFDYAEDVGYLPVYVNAAQLAYVGPRRSFDSSAVDGTLLYFQQEAGVLAVREDLDDVLEALAS